MAHRIGRQPMARLRCPNQPYTPTLRAVPASQKGLRIVFLGFFNSKTPTPTDPFLVGDPCITSNASQHAVALAMQGAKRRGLSDGERKTFERHTHSSVGYPAAQRLTEYPRPVCVSAPQSAVPGRVIQVRRDSRGLPRESAGRAAQPLSRRLPRPTPNRRRHERLLHEASVPKKFQSAVGDRKSARSCVSWPQLVFEKTTSQPPTCSSFACERPACFFSSPRVNAPSSDGLP